MKYLLALSLLFSIALAQILPEQYAGLTPAQKQRYEQAVLPLQSKLKPIEQAVLAVATDTSQTKAQRAQTLSDTDRQLEAWVDNSMTKYVLMRPLRLAITAQLEALLEEVVLKVPYKPQQIKAQFNVSGAQLYSYGPGNLTLIRGTIEKGNFARGDKVIIYFKLGGPIITSIEEVVTNPGDPEEAFLLSNKVSPVQFVGGAALFIPQS